MVYPWILAMTLFGVFPEQWVPTIQKLHYISLSLYSNNACLGYLQVMRSYHRENILHLYLHSRHTENTLRLGLSHIPVMAIWGSPSGVHMLHRKCAMCFLEHWVQPKQETHQFCVLPIQGFSPYHKKGLVWFSPKYKVSTAHKTHSGFSPYSKTCILLISRKVLEKQPYSRCLKKQYKKHFTLLEMYPCRYTVIWSSLYSALHTNV